MRGETLRAISLRKANKSPGYDELVTVQPRIEAGHLLLPDGPGWGTEVNEEAVRAHPPCSG